MLDAYIIERIRQEEEARRRNKNQRPQIPLPLPMYPPDFDGYKEEPGEKDKSKRGYIEIDITGDQKDDANIIEL